MNTDLHAFLAGLLVLSGAAFALIAAIGVVRMPDLFCRMHAATKAGAFGVSLILLALSVALPEPRVIVQALLIIAFFYLTAPVAAHMVGRAALRIGTPIWRHDATQPDVDGPASDTRPERSEP